MNIMSIALRKNIKRIEVNQAVSMNQQSERINKHEEKFKLFMQKQM